LTIVKVCIADLHEEEVESRFEATFAVALVIHSRSRSLS
jgi:hypothetical protein